MGQTTRMKEMRNVIECFVREMVKELINLEDLTVNGRKIIKMALK
jgi:hypothetical protein